MITGGALLAPTTLGIVAVVALAISPIHVTDSRIWVTALLLAVAAGLLALTPRVPEAAPVTRRAVALASCWAVQVLLAYDAMAVAPFAIGELADGWLGIPERLAGLDYHPAAAWLREAGGWWLMRAAYDSCGLVILLLAAVSPPTLGRVTGGFARAGIVGLLAQLLIPAHGYDYGDLSSILTLHSGADVLLPRLVAGVFCPSFHAVGATLIGMAAWPTRWRWVGVAWWSAVLASSWVVGEHYLVDLAAGTALGWWAWDPRR